MNIINKILWITAIAFIILNSIYYSIKLKFPQLRIINVLKSLKKNQKNEVISPNDTLIMTLSSKIGVGSLSGIAIAISYGGIGTVLWIWISTFFLSIINYVENALAIIYKESGNISGPSYYIKKGLNNKKLSVVYAILILVTYTFLFITIQNNTITTLTYSTYDISKVLTSIIITLLSGIIIIKGVKTISNICNKIFPLMMLVLIIIGIYIIITNLTKLPYLIIQILTESFSKKSISGGIIYSGLIALQKSIFANEAGIGTSAIISGLTDNQDYKKQGNMGIIQTFFINFIVITIIAIIIGTTNYESITIINGIELTKYAFSYHLGSLGDIILLTIVILFSFSTIITIYYFGENSLNFLTKNNKIMVLLKIATLISLFIGGIIKANIIWEAIDIFLAILTIINMYSIHKLRNVIIPKLTRK